LTGIRVKVGPQVHKVRFTVTKHRVDLAAFSAAAIGGKPSPGPGLEQVVWERPERLAERVFGSGQRRLIAWATKA
jgi:hypothetical protein